MTLRPVLVMTALLAVACGTSEPEPEPIATGPAVDAAKGPPGGPKLGTPVGELGGKDLNTANSYGHSYSLPDQDLFGMTMRVRADVANDVLHHLSFKAVMPDNKGVEPCQNVREELTKLYGEARTAGIPFVMPMDIWQGEQHSVTWRRRVQVENNGLVCEVTFGPPVEEDEAEGTPSP